MRYLIFNKDIPVNKTTLIKENPFYAGFDRIIKIFLDYTFAVFGIFILLLFFSILALLIKIDSRGPIFYRQKRCGLRGKEFKMYKFSSMISNAHNLQKVLKNESEGPVFKIRNDPRITRIGRLFRRTSLDEVPQLINVLKGEMSLVGPRPQALEEMSGNKEWREIRLKVKPGITGLWQIKGRGIRCFDHWIHYDKEYVLNRTLLLDMKILFLTIGTVIKGKGAC